MVLMMPRSLQPAQFEAAVIASLAYLDTVLPPKSLVLLIGLVDGRVLWNTMHCTFRGALPSAGHSLVERVLSLS